MVVYMLKQCWEVGLRSTYRRCRFWWSDEALDFGGYKNKQNCRVWGKQNPHTYIEKPTHPKRVSVWCGFWFRNLIGPFFFENEQGEAVVVNGVRYRAMLNEFFFTKIKEEDIGNIWFQQDGATCHTAETTHEILRLVFEDRIINRKADIVWPPRSCELTPLDYNLRGAIKDRCYANILMKLFSITNWKDCTFK